VKAENKFGRDEQSFATTDATHVVPRIKPKDIDQWIEKQKCLARNAEALK
jgi:hypothetical protein